MGKIMKILITGASGFVGTSLCRFFLERGEQVTGVGTSKRHPLQTGAFFDKKPETEHSFQWISADTTQSGKWQEEVQVSDIVINLTGKNIFGYWTKDYKAQIRSSRVMTTEHIIAAMSGDRPGLLLNTSAIGYYGDRGEDIVTESQEPGSDFLAKVCIDWESAALKASEKGTRVVLMRFGVVLGKNGGALKKMLPAFKFFAGGPLGKGLHWFPWIHMDDLIRATVFLVENKDIEGPVNLVAPQPIRHREFASALGSALNRPSLMPAPAFMIKAVMGEVGKAFLCSQRAVPAALKAGGFEFQYSNINKALKSLV